MTRVLLVEDDHDCRVTAGEYLRFLGFDVHAVADGGYALAELAREQESYDAILLDLLMPVTSGFDFLRIYRGDVPIIVLSAWSDTHDLPREVAATLLKPVDMREVARTIRELVLRKVM